MKRRISDAAADLSDAINEGKEAKKAADKANRRSREAKERAESEQRRQKLKASISPPVSPAVSDSYTTPSPASSPYTPSPEHFSAGPSPMSLSSSGTDSRHEYFRPDVPVAAPVEVQNWQREHPPRGLPEVPVRSIDDFMVKTKDSTTADRAAARVEYKPSFQPRSHALQQTLTKQQPSEPLCRKPVPEPDKKAVKKPLLNKPLPELPPPDRTTRWEDFYQESRPTRPYPPSPIRRGAIKEGSSAGREKGVKSKRPEVHRCTCGRYSVDEPSCYSCEYNGRGDPRFEGNSLDPISASRPSRWAPPPPSPAANKPFPPTKNNRSRRPPARDPAPPPKLATNIPRVRWPLITPPPQPDNTLKRYTAEEYEEAIRQSIVGPAPSEHPYITSLKRSPTFRRDWRLWKEALGVQEPGEEEVVPPPLNVQKKPSSQPSTPTSTTHTRPCSSIYGDEGAFTVRNHPARSAPEAPPPVPPKPVARSHSVRDGQRREEAEPNPNSKCNADTRRPSKFTEAFDDDDGRMGSDEGISPNTRERRRARRKDVARLAGESEGEKGSSSRPSEVRDKARQEKQVQKWVESSRRRMEEDRKKVERAVQNGKKGWL